MKALLTDFDFNKIKGLVHDFGEPEFRALQLYQWINRGVSFENMSNLPKTLTEKLSENFDASGVSINKNFVSKDKSVKYLFELRDGNLIEGILSFFILYTSQ